MSNGKRKAAGRAATAGELVGALQGRIQVLAELLQQRDQQVTALSEALGQILVSGKSIRKRLAQLDEEGKAPTLDAPLSAFLGQLSDVIDKFSEQPAAAGTQPPEEGDGSGEPDPEQPPEGPSLEPESGPEPDSEDLREAGGPAT